MIWAAFDEIAHHRGSRGGRADTFEAGFRDGSLRPKVKITKNDPYQFEVTFGKRWSTPFPVRRREAFGVNWIEEIAGPRQTNEVFRIGTSRGAWELTASESFHPLYEGYMSPLYFYLRMFLSKQDSPENTPFKPRAGSPALDTQDRFQLRELFSSPRWPVGRRPYTSAPVRSRPHRTYDPSTDILDSEGDYVPTYLANLSAGDDKNWRSLKTKLESFGKDAGLFD